MRPQLITFTGVDDHTSHEAMVALAREHSIEWGILFHPQTQGTDRFASLATIEAVLGHGLACSAHLCGGYARKVVTGKPLPGEIVGLLGGFKRIQVNVAQRGVEPARVADFAARFEARGILQWRGTERFPMNTDVDWLFDRSGGRGLLPERWPVPTLPGALVGYSGGLGPETIATALAQIAATHPADTPFWLDMEGAIRTEGRLDLGKCGRVVELGVTGLRGN